MPAGYPYERCNEYGCSIFFRFSKFGPRCLSLFCVMQLSGYVNDLWAKDPVALKATAGSAVSSSSVDSSGSGSGGVGMVRSITHFSHYREGSFLHRGGTKAKSSISFSFLLCKFFFVTVFIFFCARFSYFVFVPCGDVQILAGLVIGLVIGGVTVGGFRSKASVRRAFVRVTGGTGSKVMEGDGQEPLRRRTKRRSSVHRTLLGVATLPRWGVQHTKTEQCCAMNAQLHLCICLRQSSG